LLLPQTFLKHLIPPQFIPNSLIFFIVLVSAECSRYTIQAVGQLIHELDQKLKLFQISFSNSQRRIKRLSIFAAFRNKLQNLCHRDYNARLSHSLHSCDLLWQQHFHFALCHRRQSSAVGFDLLLACLHRRQSRFADVQFHVLTLHDGVVGTTAYCRQDY